LSDTTEFATVKAAVEAALGKPPFSISGATLSSPAIGALLTAQFGDDALDLEGAEKQAETPSSITVRGTLAGSYMGAERLAVSAVFAVVESQASLSAAVSGFPSAWTLSRAFPSLKGSLFDALSYTSPSFTLDSTDATKLPQDFPAEYGVPAYPGALVGSLEGGLSFQATAAVIAGFEGIEGLIGGSSWEMSGPVASVNGLPSISLSSETLKPFTAGPFSLGFAIAMAAALVVETNSKPVGVTSVLQFEAKLEKQLSESTLKIPLAARTFTPSLQTIVVAGELDQLHPLTAADIGLLIDESAATELPSVFPELKDIGLSALSITIAPATMQVVSLEVAVAFLPQAKSEWSVFDGLIVFEELTIDFIGLPPSDVASVGVDALATIAGGKLDAGVVLPATEFHCKLEQGTIDIAEIVKDVSSSTIAMPKVTCTALAFTGSVTERWYRFQATVTDDWTVTIPGSSKAIGITEIGMDLTYVPGAAAPLTGQVIGTFEIGKAQLYASAAYEGGTTPGWLFEGGTQGEQEISVNDVVDDVLQLFGWSLPGNAPQVVLKNLNLAFRTATNEFSLHGMASVTIAGVECDLGVQIQDEAEGKLFNGYLWIGANAFELDFETGKDTVVAGSWTATDESSILSLDHLIDALELSLPDLPSSLNPTLTGAGIVYDITNDVLVLIGDTQDGSSALLVVEGKPTTQVGFAALAKVGLNLSDLPLVGQRLAAVATAEIDALQVSVASAPLASVGAALNQRVASYAAMLSKLSYPSFPTPPAGTTAKAWLGATFDYGSGKVPLGLALDGGGSPPKAPTTLAPGSPAQATPSSPGAQVPASTATSDGTVWFNVQRSFGPVTLQRVGASYQSSAQALWFELDAQLAFGPLTLDLLGLGLGSPIDGFKPEFALGGLGIDYAEPPLTIAGGLVNLAPKGASFLEFEGGVTIGTGDFTLTAFGYYGDKSGFPSMFLFGDVAYDFGGPPQFFVTGLALGFGYNSALRTPAIEQVGEFPFIEVLPTSAAPGPGVFGSNPTPLKALTTLLETKPPWVATSKDSLWFAAGITFTTFELLNSQALVTVQTGKELVIALLGTSRAQFPQEGGGPLYAYVELDLEAVLAPQQGVFSFQAVLAKTSFLLDRSCVLTGGFAFFVWFGENPHAGDFVLTLGGYNPGFTPPSHYPVVQPLGFHWSLDSSISIQGGVYFALTPSALMLGGELEATFQSGNLKAWFDAHADVVIQWKPFWVYADIGITVGASYKIDLLFTSFTVSIELGCELTLWGPPTGGTVEVDWYVISFSIPFGHELEPPPSAATWADVEKMLPSNGDATAQPISIAPTAGLHPAATTPKPPATDAATSGEAAGQQWTVRAGAFAFSSSAIVPSTKLTVGAAHAFQGAGFDVRPLAASKEWQNVESVHEVRIAPVAAPREDMSASFSAVPVFKDVPSSLWGEPVAGEGPSMPVPAGDRQLLPGRLSGVQLCVNPPQIGCSAGPVEVSVSLAFDDLQGEGALPLSEAARPAGDAPIWTAGVVGTIADPEHGIGSQVAAQARKAIVDALAGAGYAPMTRDDAMSELAAGAACLFADVPLVVA
jgi:hypothetical protein